MPGAEVAGEAAVEGPAGIVHAAELDPFPVVKCREGAGEDDHRGDRTDDDADGSC